MSKIEWTDKTWNPVTGCTKISEGCQNCYAAKMAKRLAGRYGYPKDDPFQVTSHEDKINQPLHWKKPLSIFVCSMGDLFHKDASWLDVIRIFNVMHRCKQHTFMVLTKRAFIMKQFCAYYADYIKVGLPPNLLPGITTENQKWYDERWEVAKKISTSKLFISAEPLLGPIELRPWGRKPDWVICGCESGTGRRETKTEWIRNLKDQCIQSGTPFFLKQMDINGKLVKMPELDGRIWDQYPEV